MTFLLACFLGLVDNPIYRPNDFYYYDEKGNAVGLPLQPKVYIRSDKILFAQLSQFEGIVDWEKLDDSHVVINFIKAGYENPVLSVLNNFAEETLPVIVWKGQECVPTNIITIETKPAVDINLLKNRLSNFGEFTTDDLSEVSPATYRLSVSNLKMPTNIFVLANLIAEDTAYVRWARPVFQFIRDPIQVSMYVTSNGLDSLGDKRFLHLDVHIFDSKITLLKDLVPQLGEGNFSLDEDIWFWADKPVITETKNNTEQIISFVWPFIYLNVGDFTFYEINIPYNQINGDEKIEKTISVSNCKFQIGSVINGANPLIEDIQPAHEYFTSSPNLGLVIPPNIGNWEIYRPASAVICLCLAMFFSHHLFKDFAKWLKEAREKNTAIYDNSLYWGSLLMAAEAPIMDWRVKYQNIESKLRIALEHFGLDASSGILKSIFEELERVYQDEGNPSSENIEILVENIRSFVIINRGKESVNG